MSAKRFTPIAFLVAIMFALFFSFQPTLVVLADDSTPPNPPPTEVEQETEQEMEVELEHFNINGDQTVVSTQTGSNVSGDGNTINMPTNILVDQSTSTTNITNNYNNPPTVTPPSITPPPASDGGNSVTNPTASDRERVLNVGCMTQGDINFDKNANRHNEKYCQGVPQTINASAGVEREPFHITHETCTGYEVIYWDGVNNPGIVSADWQVSEQQVTVDIPWLGFTIPETVNKPQLDCEAKEQALEDKAELTQHVESLISANDGLIETNILLADSNQQLKTATDEIKRESEDTSAQVKVITAKLIALENGQQQITSLQKSAQKTSLVDGFAGMMIGVGNNSGVIAFSIAAILLILVISGFTVYRNSTSKTEIREIRDRPDTEISG